MSQVSWNRFNKLKAKFEEFNAAINALNHFDWKTVQLINAFHARQLVIAKNDAEVTAVIGMGYEGNLNMLEGCSVMSAIRYIAYFRPDLVPADYPSAVRRVEGYNDNFNPPILNPDGVNPNLNPAGGAPGE